MTEQNGKGSEHEKRLARARVVRGLQSLPAKKRMDAIIDSPESAALVRAMPVQDLYSTIMDVGLVDATELVQMASPAQFQGFIDLSTWQKDRLDPRSVLTWLRAARGEDEQDFLKKLHKMDLELLELVLRHYVRVYDLEENPDVRLTGVTLETPEGKYLLDIQADGIELAAIRQLVNDLIAENPFEATRLFEATRWELPSELEHTAHQFRSARLQDLGFPTAERAHAIFSFVKPPPVRVEGESSRLDLARYQRVDYFDAAVSGLDELEQENLGAEVRALANAALVAEAAEPGDLDAVRRVAEMVRDTLSLGLEHLTGGVASRATEVVQETELRRIFQVGFSLGLQLKFRADRLAKRPLARRENRWLLLAEQAAALEALRGPRPRRALRVEGAEPVPFRSRAELFDSENHLERAERQNELVAALLGEEPQATLAALELPEEQLDAERIFIAALAHALLEGTPRVAAVTEKRLAELGQLLVEAANGDVRVRDSARSQAGDVIGKVVPSAAHPELQRVIDSMLELLARELGRSLLEDPEPRVAGALIPLTSR